MPSPTEIAAERLSWMMTSWKSMEIIIEEHYVNDPSLQPQYIAYRTTNRYIETATGSRAYTEILTLDQTTSPELTGTSKLIGRYTDGKRSAKLDAPDVNNPTKGQLIIRRAFGSEANGTIDAPMPLSLFYIGLTPLHKAIVKAEHLETNRHLDRDCDLFLFRDVPFGPNRFDYVYWLDHETSIPLKVCNYRSQAMREAGFPLMTWAAESVEKIGGRWFPVKSNVHYEHGEEPTPRQSLGSGRLDVKLLAFDKTYDKAEFWPKIGEETIVFDETTDRIKAPPKPAATKTQAKTVADPIRADGVDSAWGWVAGPSILFGILALIVGLILHRRASD
jgi:hypothetical protein